MRRLSTERHLICTELGQEGLPALAVVDGATLGFIAVVII